MKKRLYKSNTDIKLTGVCGGFAEYIDADPTFVRLAVTALTFFFGAGLWIYIAAAIIVPRRPIGE